VVSLDEFTLSDLASTRFRAAPLGEKRQCSNILKSAALTREVRG
jgi:hypothetical protein